MAIEVGVCTFAIVFADFDHDLKHLGVVLEILSLNMLLKIFKKSSIVNLTTGALKPLLPLLNRYRSRRSYFRNYIFTNRFLYHK